MTVEEAADAILSYISRSKGITVKNYNEDDFLDALEVANTFLRSKHEPLEDWPTNLLKKAGILPIREDISKLEENLLTCLKTIGEKEEKALLLHYRDGLSLADVGRKMECSRGNAEMAVKRGEELLRDEARRLLICCGEEAAHTSRALRKDYAKTAETLRDAIGKMKDEDIRKAEEEMKSLPLYERSIDHMNLPKRLLLAMKRNGIEKIGDLDGISRKELLMMRTVGTKAADEMIEKIREFGMEVREGK